ncbi:MAG: D-aminoacyl-tRNA deacylase [Actinomycetota bacterium]
MRVVVQRVTEGRVIVAGDEVGAIGPGLVLLVGVASSDSMADVDAVVRKIVGLRVFSDDAGQMNRSVADVGGSILVVSQFTLQADIRKGRRPSFTDAARPTVAEPLVDAMCEALIRQGVATSTGTFGAHMHLELTNDGPVTIVIDSLDGQLVR